MEVLLRKYLWVLDLLVVAGSATFLAHASTGIIESKLLAGAAPAAPTRRMPVLASSPGYNKAFEEILKRNIFCSTCPPILPPTGPDPSSTQTSNELTKTSLPLKLLAVMYQPNATLLENWSVAIIRDTDLKASGAYGLGGKVRDATVTEILETRVIFDNQGRREYLDLLDKPMVAPTPSPAAGPADGLAGIIDKGLKKTGEHTYEVQRSALDAVLGNMSELSRSARIVPEIKDGKPAGFRLYSVRPDGPFAKIGLQNGDVISSINGIDMSSPDKAIEAYTKLRSASHLSLSMERGGQKVVTDYSIR